jgi:hypothetical protein
MRVYNNLPCGETSTKGVAHSGHVHWESTVWSGEWASFVVHFLSSISFGQSKEMDSGFGVKPHEKLIF